MHIENFKGIRCIDLDFGQTTEIRGRNATGKTTIADAFTWCLFGKDSTGRAAFNLKTIDENGVIHKIDHFVELTLCVQTDTGTKKAVLKRLLKEDWVKPRGKAEPVMQGNSTSYFVDGVEVKATQYAAEVSSIIDEQMFRLVTSPTYFPTMDWKSQREMLVKMAGNVTYADVAFDSEMKRILSQLSGIDMATFKARIASRKKPIKEELEECPTRISAIESVTPEPMDFDGIEAEMGALKKEFDGNLTLISDKAKANDAKFADIQARQKHVNEMRLRQMSLVADAEQAEQQRCAKANSDYNEQKMRLEALQRELALFKSQSANELKSIDADIASNKERAERLGEECDDLRRQWAEVNGRAFEEKESEITCPLLNIACKDANVIAKANEHKANARKAFNEKKAAELSEITANGKAKMEEKRRIGQYVVELNEKRATRSVEIAEEEKRRGNDIESLGNQLAGCKVEQPRKIEPTDISEWVMLEESIKAEEDTIQEPERDNDTSLVDRNAELQERIKALGADLAKRDTIGTNKAKIAEIEEREKTLAQQLADLEGQEYHAERLEKAYVSEVECRVNKMFEMVKFRMFEKQINGGEAPTCVAMVGNVPYQDLNNASKINAGIDIINTLGRHSNISAPVFIDNAESVNQVRHTDSQLVLLIVTEDDQLNVTSK